MAKETTGGQMEILVKELHVRPRLDHAFFSASNLAVVTTTTVGQEVVFVSFINLLNTHITSWAECFENI